MVLQVGALRVGQSETTTLLTTPSTPLPPDGVGAGPARLPSGPLLECDESSADIAGLESADGPDGARARLLASGTAWCRRARLLRYEAPVGLARYTGGPATPATRDGALLGGWSGEEEAIAQALVAMPSLRRGAVPALGGAAGAAPAPALAPDEQQRGPRRVNVALTFAAPATGGGEGAAVASPGAFEAAGVGTPTAAPGRRAAHEAPPRGVGRARERRAQRPRWRGGRAAARACPSRRRPPSAPPSRRARRRRRRRRRGEPRVVAALGARSSSRPRRPSASRRPPPSPPPPTAAARPCASSRRSSPPREGMRPRAPARALRATHRAPRLVPASVRRLPHQGRI